MKNFIEMKKEWNDEIGKCSIYFRDFENNKNVELTLTAEDDTDTNTTTVYMTKQQAKEISLQLINFLFLCGTEDEHN